MTGGKLRNCSWAPQAARETAVQTGSQANATFAGGHVGASRQAARSLSRPWPATCQCCSCPGPARSTTLARPCCAGSLPFASLVTGHAAPRATAGPRPHRRAADALSVRLRAPAPFGLGLARALPNSTRCPALSRPKNAQRCDRPLEVTLYFHLADVLVLAIYKYCTLP